MTSVPKFKRGFAGQGNIKKTSLQEGFDYSLWLCRSLPVRR